MDSADLVFNQLYPLAPENDYHVISYKGIGAESNIRLMRIKEMIANMKTF